MLKHREVNEQGKRDVEAASTTITGTNLSMEQISPVLWGHLRYSPLPIRTKNLIAAVVIVITNSEIMATGNCIKKMIIGIKHRVLEVFQAQEHLRKLIIRQELQQKSAFVERVVTVIELVKSYSLRDLECLSYYLLERSEYFDDYMERF